LHVATNQIPSSGYSRSSNPKLEFFYFPSQTPTLLERRAALQIQSWNSICLRLTTNQVTSSGDSGSSNPKLEFFYFPFSKTGASRTAACTSNPKLEFYQFTSCY
jgi:hypothetical protein